MCRIPRGNWFTESPVERLTIRLAHGPAPGSDQVDEVVLDRALDTCAWVADTDMAVAVVREQYRVA